MPHKTAIKLNEDDNYFSLGNIFRIIKEVSIEPNSFLQTDLFSIIFNCEPIASSTVNNYCTGLRAINSSYKNYMIEKRKKYNENKLEFILEISTILNLITTGKLETARFTVEKINSDTKLKFICSKLYTISKNDIKINTDFSNKLFKLNETNNLYEFIVESLLFAVLEYIQPIYKEDVLSSLIETNLIDTNISVENIESYIKLQLKEGIWSLRGINELANNNNPYACFEMASLEFYGIISGNPRYDKSYEYYKKAAESNHPVANWAIGFLLYNGYIGNRRKEDLEKAYEYFQKAIKQKCPSAFNSMGLIYLHGDVPGIQKNKEKALHFFETGKELGNVYAINNLGKIEEENKNYSKALEYYMLASNLGDSWALNRVGEFFRKGLGTEKNLIEAFNYYEKSSQCFKYNFCYWSKYNLAKYFYEFGEPEANIHKDLDKAIKLLEEVSDELIEALELLIYIYYDLYITSKNKKYKENLKEYIKQIELHKSYTEEIGNRIEQKIKKYCIKEINIDEFLS